MKNKTNIKKTRGDFGEIAVRDYLVEHGYKIVACNYRKRQGEIDIIAVQNEEIVFVEVKTRKFGSMTEGIDSVTYEKRRKIINTAHAFLRENPEFSNMNARFDAAGVVITTDDVPRLIELDYYEDAFNPALM
ncbi:MAG: YraN family protein [Oscillospiraceae bacterium]|nr:YraN family protein [Oscillospiraceae bacterium]